MKVEYSQDLSISTRTMKHTYMDTIRNSSPKGLGHCVQELDGQPDFRDGNNFDIMDAVVTGMCSKRLGYWESIAEDGLPNWAQS